MRTLPILAFATASMLMPPAADAIELKVVTEVRDANSSDLLARNETFFVSGKVYDVSAGGSVLVLDPQQQVFVLLKGGTQTTKKTLMPLDDIRAGIVDIQEALKADPQRASAWGLQSQAAFPVANRCTIESTSLHYAFDLQTEPIAGAAIVFDAFTAWTARLNALDATGAPPFMRIAASGEIAARQMVPARVVRTMAGGQQRIIAAHHYFPQLNEADRERIAQFDLQIKAAPMVPYASFRAE